MSAGGAAAPVIVTLLSDFGAEDYFVAAMKGVILSALPAATLVDVTHQVPPQDIRAGAFNLLAAYGCFPPGTVHVAVVDPGVGSERRALVVEAGGHRFVGPDNGLFGWIVDREPGARAFHATDPAFFRHPVSTTFHGRDVFAPVAAALAGGASASEVGPEVADIVRLEPLRPERGEAGELRGSVLHVDRFGNCVTSFTRDDVGDHGAHGIRLEANGHEIRVVRRYYAEESTPGRVFAIWGSAELLELSANRDSAARILNVRPGTPLVLSPA